MWKCSYLLSRMLSNVHWSFLKKGWRLISSTPVRPKRTVLHTATQPTTLWVRLLSPNLKHTQLRLFFFLPPPSSPTCHPKHKPSKSGPLTTMTGKETHSDHKWTLTTPSPPDLIRETWNWVQLDLQVNSLLPLGFSDFIKHFFSSLLAFISGYRTRGVRQFRSATCGTFQSQPRGREAGAGRAVKPPQTHTKILWTNKLTTGCDSGKQRGSRGESDNKRRKKGWTGRDTTRE